MASLGVKGHCCSRDQFTQSPTLRPDIYPEHFLTALTALWVHCCLQTVNA